MSFFPANPVNTDTVVLDGVTYEYDASLTAWKRLTRVSANDVVGLSNYLSNVSGWAPVLALVSDGERRVHQVIDWTGGTGTKPAAGSYIGVTGLVATAAAAVDVRGAAGPTTAGAIVTALTGAPELPQVQALVSRDLVLSATDAAANSATIIAAGGGNIPVGVWPITPIAAAVDITLTGVGKHRSVLTSATDADGYLIQSTGRLCINDVGIRGVHNTAKGARTTAAGMQSGVLLDARNGSYVKDSAVYGFGNIGVGLFGDSTANDLGPSIGGNDIYNNFSGIDTGNALNTSGLGEYAKIYGNSIIDNTYGIIVRSGNVNISGANSLQYNGEGIWVVGAANNGAHGTICGNMINHSYRVSLRLENIYYGHIITGNTVFGNTSSVIMTGCSAVQFNNNLLFIGSLSFSGAAWNSFADNVFYGAMPTITDTSGTKWRDNYSTVNSAYVGLKFSFQADDQIAYSASAGPQGANKVVNGDFSSSTGWTTGAGWAIGGGVATGTATNALLYCALTGGNTANTQYQIDFDLTGSGQVVIGIGGSAISARYSGAGTKSLILNTGSGVDGNLYVIGYSFSGTIDNIVVRPYVKTGDMTTTRIGGSEYLYVGTTKFFSGAGSPEGVITATVGSEYTRTDGAAGTPAAPGTLKYVKTSGSGATGWSAVL